MQLKYLERRSAGDPVIDFPRARKELSEHRSLRRQAGQLRNVLGQAHATVWGTHAKTILATEEALRRR